MMTTTPRTPPRRCARVALFAGLLAVSGCSASAAGASSGPTRAAASSVRAAISGQPCQASILRIFFDLLAYGTAWRRDLVPPGRPLSPARGGPNPAAAARAAAGTAAPVAACPVVTTSYVAAMYDHVIAVGGPKTVAALRKEWQSLTPAKLKQAEHSLLYGTTGTPKPAVRSIKVVSRSKDTAKVRVTVVERSAQYGTVAMLMTDTVFLLDGRWFAASVSPPIRQPS